MAYSQENPPLMGAADLTELLHNTSEFRALCDRDERIKELEDLIRWSLPYLQMILEDKRPDDLPVHPATHIKLLFQNALERT